MVSITSASRIITDLLGDTGYLGLTRSTPAQVVPPHNDATASAAVLEREEPWDEGEAPRPGSDPT